MFFFPGQKKENKCYQKLNDFKFSNQTQVILEISNKLTDPENRKLKNRFGKFGSEFNRMSIIKCGCWAQN